MVHPKDRVTKNQKYGIAYKITCRDCEKIYVRQTGHSVNQRITEDKRALSSLDFNMSAVAEHAIKKDHNIGWEDFEIFGQSTETI